MAGKRAEREGEETGGSGREGGGRQRGRERRQGVLEEKEGDVREGGRGDRGVWDPSLSDVPPSFSPRTPLSPLPPL